MLRMIDRKLCNAATDTASTMTCYISFKCFNKLIETEEANVEAFKFGLSVLQARIRFFEPLMHLDYK